MNADGLGALSSTDSVIIFSAVNAVAVLGQRLILQVALVPAPAGNRRLTLIYVCNNGTNYRCSVTTGSVYLIPGTNRFEFDVQMATSGANGSIRYWINAPTGSTEPPPSGSVTGIDNSAWGGVKVVSLGLGSPSPSFSSLHAGQVVYFDGFRSNRRIYIGF
jgi:hypothetical protein